MARLALSAFIVSAMASAAALAQTSVTSAEPCDDDCTAIIIFGQATTQSSLQKSRAVSGIVGKRLAPGSGAPQGTALQYAPSQETDDPAAQAIRGETVSLATNDPAMYWNAWFDGSFVYVDRDHPSAGYDGPMFIASLGSDRKIGDSSVLGLLVNFEYADFDTGFGVGGRQESQGFGIGVYGGSALTEHIVADAMVIWSHLDNDVVEFGSPNSFDSNRIQAAANLTGYWYRDAWRFSPTVGITYSFEDQDSYGGTPSRTLDSAIAIAGLQVGHTTFLDDVRTIEPWVGVNAEWEFHSTGASGIGSVNLDPFDIRLLGGLNAQLSQSVSATLKADIAGLARSDYLTGTFGGQISVGF